MNDPQELFDVFLSYPHAEADAVKTLGVTLENDAGLKVWLDRWILVPGEQWQQAMAKGLDQARTCAVCVGDKTPSGWFQQEIERALNRQAQDKSFRVIPVILPNGDRKLIDNFLELRTWVEFKNGLQDRQALHLLVCGVRGIRPGRLMDTLPDESRGIEDLRIGLQHIRSLRGEKLIDDKIAQEFQRRLLDDLLVKPKRRR